MKKIILNKNLKLYALIQFFSQFTLISGVLIPFFMGWGKLAFSQIMLLQAIFMISVFIFEIPTGAIADKFGRKKSLILGGFVAGIGFLSYSIYPHFALFILGEVLIALSRALSSGADTALLYDTLKSLKYEKESQKIINKMQKYAMFGGMVSAPLGSLIASFFSVRTPVILTIIPMFFVSIISMKLKEPPIHKKEISYINQIKDGTKYFAKNKIIQKITFNYISTTALCFFLIWAYQVVLGNLNLNLTWFGFVSAGLFIVEMILLHFYKKIEKVFKGKRNYLLVSAIICGLSFIVLAFTKKIFLALILIFLIAAFGLTRKPIYVNYMHKHVESHHRATVLSVVSMIYGIISSIFLLILGKITDFDIKYALITAGSLILIFSFISLLEESTLID